MNLIGRTVPWLAARGCVRAVVLRLLWARTAAAFGERVPRVAGWSAQATLRGFAEFTTVAARESHPGDAARLFEVAYGPGRWLRRLFGIASTEDVMAVARLAYQLLDIDFRGSPAGDIVIPRCSFSTWYSPAACQVMSALDAGLLAGLSGGGRLEFSERITEGRPSCRAHLSVI